MARVVLAELDLEEGPLLEAQARSREGFVALEGGASQSARRMSREWDRTGSLFVNRMFSMRQAMIALLGGFTIGGVILSLRNFAAEIVKSAEGFETFSRVSDDASRRLARFAADALNVSDLLRGMTEWLDRIVFLVEKLPEERIGRVVGFLFGQTNLGQLLKVIDAAGDLIDKMAGRPPVGEIVKAVPVSAREFKELIDITQPLIDAGEFMETTLVPSTREWVAALRNAADEAQRLRLVWFDLISETARVTEEDIGDIATAVERASATYESFGVVASSALEAISAAAAAGVVSQTAAARIAMGILAIEAILKGKIELAEAVAAAARFDFASATLHGVAAGLYFAAAAFHAKGAIAGPSGGSGGFGRSTGQNFAQAAPTRSSQSFTIIIEGNVDSDERIRQIMESLRTATADNA